MPLLDLDLVTPGVVILDTADIELINPHRGCMRQIDRVLWIDEKPTSAIGEKDITENEFWVEGHIPGRPLMPGVMQIEACAQLASIVQNRRYPGQDFVGFTRAEECSFRGAVVPGDKLRLLSKEIKSTNRRFITDVQAMVGDKVVFQGRITGMLI